MKLQHVSARVVELASDDQAASSLASNTPRPARLVEIGSDGSLTGQTSDGRLHACDWLAGSATFGVALAVGDTVLMLPMPPGYRPVVIGRVGRYSAPTTGVTLPNVTIEASESLSLKCGEASIDLRADGKVMVRGEDVLLRAKGTQRIRAGTVSIN